MIAGTTLDKLGEMIVSQHAEKRDVVAPTTQLALVTPSSPSLSFDVNGSDIVAELTPHALRQLATWAGIPAKYVDRISVREHHELLAANVNHWLQASDDKRLVRMLQGERTVARAFLSDRYRPLDNYDLALHIMPRLREAGMSIKSAALTDTRLYIQAVDMSLMARIQPGLHQRETKDDMLYAGVVISNSEIGAGSLSIESMVWRLICTNGLIAGTGLRRAHLGRALSGGNDGDPFELFKDETKVATDNAFWLQVRDVIDAALSESQFRAIVDRMQQATAIELPADPSRIVEVTAQRLGLNGDESDTVMRHLFAGGDSTLYGLMNAVTRTAEDSTSYDRAVELERLGSDVLTFNPAAFSKN